MKRDYYATLQVDPGADPEVIEAAYRRLARKWHPDTNADPQAGDRMQELNQAYEVLRDPARRRGYDDVRAVQFASGPRVAWRRVSPLVVTLVTVVGALVGVRFLGALVRMPLALVLFAAAAYWFVQSLGRRRR